MSSNGTPRRLPVIQVEHVTDGADYFACAPYNMSLSARACIGRQKEANRELRVKDRWMSGRGRLDFRHCGTCRIGLQVIANVDAGPARAPRAGRRGSVMLPDRTRELIRELCAAGSIYTLARVVKLSPATVRRAILVGQIRRKSFNRLRRAFPEAP